MKMSHCEQDARITRGGQLEGIISSYTFTVFTRMDADNEQTLAGSALQMMEFGVLTPGHVSLLNLGAVCFFCSHFPSVLRKRP